MALAMHIRKEERQLFEGMQKALSAEQLTRVGAKLRRELEPAPSACSLPNQATRLRPRRK
jgi:hypothetical protein